MEATAARHGRGIPALENRTRSRAARVRRVTTPTFADRDVRGRNDHLCQGGLRSCATQILPSPESRSGSVT